MTWPITFANLPGGAQPLLTFDTQFNANGAASIIACTATGGNTVVLMPNANYFSPTSYSDDGPIWSWVQQTTSTGPVTINGNSIGALNAYKANGQQPVGGGDLIAGMTYRASTNASLNAGAGGFVVDVMPVAAAGSVIRSYLAGLTLSTAGSSATFS